MCDPYINSCLALASHQGGEMRKLIKQIFLAYGTRSGLIQSEVSHKTHYDFWMSHIFQGTHHSVHS
jgi:hypothetical protein